MSHMAWREGSPSRILMLGSLGNGKSNYSSTTLFLTSKFDSDPDMANGIWVSSLISIMKPLVYAPKCKISNPCLFLTLSIPCWKKKYRMALYFIQKKCVSRNIPLNNEKKYKILKYHASESE